jgi:hypothetical protein
MNDMQSRLAELLKAGVGDPPGRVTVQAVRHQMARRRVVAAVGAAAAMAVVAAISAGLFGRVGNPGPMVSPTVSATPVPCRPGWSVAAGAAPAGDHQDRLVAIAGSASYDVWAVGDRLPDPSHVFPLLEHWDGRRWAYSAGASLGGRQAWLTSVAALSSDDVWAVGYFASGRRSPEAPLIEHWNGRSWSLRPTDALTRLKGALPQTLASVVALAPDDVWVSGHGVRGSGPFDVFLHWNGASWKLIPGPHLISPRLGSAWMQTLGTDHRGRVWAVGGWVRGQSEAGVPAGGIVERWNGRQWEVDRHAAWRKPLTMVAPVAPDDVWAITGGGFTIAGFGYGVSPVQVLHWNGRSWKVELSLGGTGSVDPTGLVAVSADDAYVIGQEIPTQQPFIDHWNGTRWRRVPAGPTRQMQRLGPRTIEFRSPSLTVTSDGSIAALDTQGLTDQANFLWFRCQH